MKLAIVVSLFNEKVTINLLNGALDHLKSRGIEDVDVIKVAGAYEIPFMAQFLAKKKTYAGIITLGCIIQGETPHFQFISDAVSHGIMNASLQTSVPITFGVLTVNSVEESEVRSTYPLTLVKEKNNSGKLKISNKGEEAAEALLISLEGMGTL